MKKPNCIDCGLDDYCFKNPSEICPIQRGLIAPEDIKRLLRK